jgi:hypothetical protein
MRRRIRIATVGAIAIMAVAALSSTAGAATPTYTTSATGGFISLSLLNLLGLTGGGSSASAQSGGIDSASGTGLCATLSESATTCPNTTNANSADVINTTAREDVPAQPGDSAQNCLIPPISLVLITLEAACGRASASEDSNNNPTAAGEGDLASVVVSLGAAVPGLGNLLGNGTLCGTPSSPANASTGAATGLVSGLLGTVNSLLGTANLPILSPTSSDPLSSVCGILSGLTSELPVLGGLLSNATASTTLLSITIGDSRSTVNSGTDPKTQDPTITTTATTEGIDINLLGMLDIKVLPNTASVTLDETTGLITAANAVTGVLSVQEGASAPTVLALPDLSSLLGNLLNSLGLSSLINPQLTTIAESTATGVGTTSGSAEAADLKLDLLGGLVVLNLGDAKVSASSAASINNIVTQPAVTPVPVITQPATTAAVVPNVTTIHTGEFWAGSLPLFLMSGMGVAGIVLIARRRLFSVARSIMPFAHHSTFGSAGGPPPGPASGTSSVPPPVSGPARRQPPL